LHGVPSVERRNEIRVGSDVAASPRFDTPGMSQIHQEDCTLRLAAEGTAEPCPRERCSFWEPGGAVVQGRCLIERLGVDVRRPDLALYLLETRERLDQTRNLAEAERAHAEFSRRIGREL
jgi:hypothetical protein